MDIKQSKKTIENLLSKSKANTGMYDTNSTFHNFVQPFFESLEWDFKSNVVDCNDDSDSAADKEFQIDGITKFFLKIIPHGTSIESSRNEITSLTTLAYNQGVTWAIATNFQETRVYNTEAPGNTLKSMEHYSFTENQYISKFDDLIDLTPHQFSRNILDSNAEWLGSKPKRIPIDKQLLKDLLSFRNLLVINIVNNNSIKNEEAEYAAQKILNRLIFIRSCGDRQIEQRHLKSSLSDWEKNKNKTLMQYLQDIFNHFNDIYGSTLFQKHSCDSLIISDGILEDIINGLYKSKEKAVKYNFAKIQHDSLGKMYENYLGTVQQKKDGAYYTPSYISKYICENTIIQYLSKSNTTTILDLLAEYENDLEELELKIHNIKILDPACGTGEFLIRAIDVLLKISKQIQRKKELQGKYQTADSTSRKAPRSLKKKKSDLTTFQTFDKDIEHQQLRKIIQNNIHGVDINEQAIEITQLNMFLKLATSSQQLIDLSKNLRVGNALVDDPNVDPNAFDWEQEFPDKFDVIVGNPPYVRQELISSIKPHLKENFSVFDGVADLYVYFFELITKVLKENGILNYIISNKWMKSNYGKNLRKFLAEYYIEEIIDFGDTQIFEGATTYPCIIKISKKNQKNSKIKSVIINNSKFQPLGNFIKFNQFYYDQNKLNIKFWNVVLPKIENLFQKINSKCVTLEDYVGEHVHFGVKTGLEEAFIIDETIKEQLIKEDKNSAEIVKPYLAGAEVGRYRIKSRKKFVIFTKRGINIENYPAIKNYLLQFKKKLTPKKNKSEKIGRKPGSYQWYELQDNIAYFKEFDKQKIIYGKTAVGPRFCYDVDGFMAASSNFILPINDMRLLGILNSKLGWFFVKNTCTRLHGGYSLLWTHLKNIPITKNNSKYLESLVVKILELNKELDEEKQDDEKSEIEKKILKIDQLIEYEVYKLYEITDEEKVIIESSI